MRNAEQDQIDEALQRLKNFLNTRPAEISSAEHEQWEDDRDREVQIALENGVSRFDVEDAVLESMSDEERRFYIGTIYQMLIRELSEDDKIALTRKYISP